jgi:signal transduction histidine kinase
MSEAALHILHLEDSRNDADLIAHTLKEGRVTCVIECVDNEALYVAALRRGGMDIILADYRIPGFDGVSALLLAMDIRPELPFIFVSGTIGEDLAIESVRLGATDYVVKDKLARLVPSVRRAILEVRERRERVMAEERLRLSEEQLLHAQKMESIGTLAGGIAHDFNNILGIILGYASVLRDGNVDPVRSGKSLDAMIAAVERGSALVRQLLTFARKSEVQFAPIRVNDAVEEVVSLCEETFPKTITFSRYLDHSIPEIVADRTQIDQALLNLCINARDAMPQGGTLKIATSVKTAAEVATRLPEARAGACVCVSVADTGTGMDAATRARIFEPFFTTKGLEKGTGLGLAIVYGVVRSHHAQIDVESEVGKGSIFHLFFPVGMPGSEPVRPKAAAPEESSGGTETILLVEDEEPLAALAKLILEDKGYRVLSARDGMEALDIFGRHAPEIDLVLTDLGLPKLDGWEAYLRMKSIRPEVSAIIATGYTDPQSRSDMLQSGVKLIVQKPYIPKTLLQVVRATLDAAGKK